MDKKIGKVQWVNASEGFGYISLNDGNEAYIELSKKTKTSVTKIQEGQIVEFDVVEGPNGPEAKNITVCAGPHGAGGGLDD